MRHRLVVTLLALLVAGACARGEDQRPTDRADRPAGAEPATMPVPRTEVAGTAWAGAIAVAGGLTREGAASARADRYDPAANKWERLPDLPVALHHSGVAALGDNLYVVGGYTIDTSDQWVPQAGVYQLTPEAPAWADATPLPEARGALAVAVLGDRIYAIGGVGPAGLSVRVDSFDGTAWRREPDLAIAREHLAAGSLDGRVFAIAGRVPNNIADVESWAPGDPRWKREASVAHARSGIAAATVGSRLCVAGGEGPEGTIAPVECFAGGKWSTVGELATPRHGLAVVGAGDRLHVIGGGPEPGLTVSGVHEVLDVGGEGSS